MPWNQREFDEACQRFRDHFPEFETFDRPGKDYLEAERVGKDKLVGLYDAHVRHLLTKSDSEFFSAYVEILSHTNDLFEWGFPSTLRNLSAAESSEFGQMLRRVVQSDASPAAITTYGWDALSFLESLQGVKSRQRHAGIRNLVSLLLMLHNPKTYMCAPLTYFNRCTQKLLGEKLIKSSSQLTGPEFERCQDFAGQLLDQLENAGFCPQDMIDVQAFLYVVSKPAATSIPTWNKRAFESSIVAFKRRYQGFEDFSKNCGEQYDRLQRQFKREMRTKYNAILKPLIEADPVEFVDAYAEITNCTLDSKRPSGDEGWRVVTNEVPIKKKAEFGSMLQSLVNETAAKANETEWESIVANYSEKSEHLFVDHVSSGDSHDMRRMLREAATLLLSLRWPKKYVHATQEVWNVAAKKFLGRELIKDNDVLTSRLLEDDLWGFTRKINFGLKDAGLAPRDLADKFDTQSFLWSVYDESMVAKDPDSPAIMDKRPLDLTTIIRKIRSEGMRIDESTVRQYHFSMRIRGFVILAGPSGVGKTWLTRLYAKALASEYLLAPVAPNWSTNEDLLGFFNPIDGEFHATAFLHFIDRAASSWDELGHHGPEFHLVLDEMNLARVEHYFSLFLSLMEMRRETGVPETRLTGDRVVRVPPNLKFAGTVNMDETTHGFADKVFDRAQLIELSIPSDAAREHVSERIGENPAAEVLLDLWARMAPACPVGFRVLDDIADYLTLAGREGVDWRVALDDQIFSKLLPKLRGLDPEVVEALRLIDARVDGEFPRASAKCKSMLQRVQATDVVSFF